MAGLRRGFVVLSTLLLIASVCVPIATATAQRHGKSFGGLSRVEKTVGKMQHVDSMRAVAHDAALHPRTDKAPALNIPTPNFGRPSAPAKVSPVFSAKTTSAPRPLIVTPDVAESTTFAGLAQGESGDVTPADPWVAVNSSFVVQAVNSMVRISNRSGTTLTSVPLDAFFSIEPGYFPTDPRIIWDATHGKWVGEVAFFNGDFSSNGFVLATSEGSDPTQGWNMWPIFFGDTLPDFPSLASSNDKIVIADDLYDSSLAFVAADINTFKWSEINAGTAVFDRFCDDSSYVHPRAAQVLSSSNDVHVAMETTDGNYYQAYVRVTGAGSCGEIADLTDLTGLGFPALSGAAFPAPAPRQPGPDTIDNATDGRFTDAVWRNNTLYWVNTDPFDFGGTKNDQVIVWATQTTSGSGSPSGFSYARMLLPDGTDAYMGGIGLTRNGIPVMTWSQSSSTDPIAFYAADIVSLGAPGTIGTPVLLDTSEGSINGERWGDYAGVAMDPVGTGSVWVTHMLSDESGNWRTTIARMLVDNDLPSTPGTPATSPVTNTKLGILPKFKVSWGASTDGMSGTVQYQLDQNVDGGGWSFAGLFTGTSTTRSLNPDHTYQFRVTPFDPLHNLGATATGPVLHISTAQSPTSKTGTWHTSSSGNYVNGSTWYASGAGASASYKATSVRSIAFITTKASTRGSFRVYIDGHLKATINAHASTAYRQVVYQYSWSSPGTHTIKIVVVGSSGHPRVDFDAVLLIK
jgi:hypothetical protein